MTSSIDAIVNRQIQRSQIEARMLREQPASPPPLNPMVTLSRTLGSGGTEIARKTAERLHCQVFDREILDRIADMAEARRDLAEALDEQTRSRIENWIEGMLHGKIFDEGDYHHRLVQVVGALAELGSAVIVGRGANFILRNRIGIDVRIVAPKQARIKRLMAERQWTAKQAADEIHASDAAREKFIRRIFNANWNDPEIYDLIINTQDISLDSAAALIECAWQERIR